MDRDWIFRSTIQRVVDADTFDITIELGFDISQDIRFRLTGANQLFDAPETWRPKYASERKHGETATEFVKGIIEGKSVSVRSVRKGKYRYVAVIYFDDGQGNMVDLAEHLIVEGYQKLKESEYIRLDEEYYNE